MTNNISPGAAAAVFAEATGEVFLTILTLTNPDDGSVFRFVNNYESIISNGEIFEAHAFTLAWPEEGSDQAPSVSITLDNVGLELMTEIRSLVKRPTATIALILASDPDTLELEQGDLQIVSASYDLGSITFDAVIDDLLNQKVPSGVYDRTSTPNIFVVT